MDGTREEWSILRYSPSPSVCTDGDSVGREFVTKSGSLHVQGDSGLTCLKLGKRQYFVEGTVMKREKLNVGNNGGSSSSPVSVVPRCQVEGCHVELKVAKEYHKRHKVCEMHSKSPKVVVLGLEQRFCQQCSRFHVVSEFDDAKRSCRRRLAGHNERRRKNTNDSLIKSSSQENGIISNRFPCDTSGRALSLLSSKNTTSVLPAADLSSRSSAALRELIAENRAAILAMQLFSDRNLAQQHTLEESSTSSMVSYGYASHHRNLLNPAAGMEPRFDGFNESGNSSHVTLDLMQTPTSSFGILPGRNKSKDDNDCSGIWNSLEGSQMV